MTPTPDTAAPRGATLLPCPFCGQTPDVESPHTFREVNSSKWGAVVCCCTGPEVRTGYGPVEEWKADAIEAWNERVPVEPPVQYPLTVEAPAAAVEAGAGEAGGWLDIASAPKDGTVVCLASADTPVRVALGCWRSGGTSWVDRYGQLDGEAYELKETGVWDSEGGWFQPNEVTHWMPLPKPPGATPTDAAPPARVTAEMVAAALKTPYVSVGGTTMTLNDLLIRVPLNRAWKLMEDAITAALAAPGAGHD